MTENKQKFFKKSDVIYGRIGNQELKGTLFLPDIDKNAEKIRSTPVVIYIHGGGWRGGSRERFYTWAEKLTMSGMAGFCISYRLSKKNKYPAAIQDTKCAVRFLRANAEKYGINPDRIGAVGSSAGAHLAACLATTGNKRIKTWENSGGYTNFDSNIHAAVLFNGEFDLPGWWDYRHHNDFMLDFMGKSFEKVPEIYKEASPLFHIDNQTCPCLLVHGEKDNIAPLKQSVDFYQRLTAAGGKADLIRVPEAGHAWFYDEPYNSQCLQYTREYLLKHLTCNKNITAHLF